MKGECAWKTDLGAMQLLFALVNIDLELNYNYRIQFSKNCLALLNPVFILYFSALMHLLNFNVLI